MALDGECAISKKNFYLVFYSFNLSFFQRIEISNLTNTVFNSHKFSIKTNIYR
jgi:hypothetical protein